MRNGFTLVETLVVVAITLFLSGILLSYNRSTDGMVVLAAEQARVTNVIFRAKTFALQKNIRSGSESACGFGVHFTKPGSLILFEDLPLVVGDCSTSNHAYDEGELLEEVLLSGRIALESFSQDEGADEMDIVFDAPYLFVTNPGVITLASRVTGDTRSVQVGAGGEISSQ